MKRSFTLIELVVTVGIITMITLFSLPSISKYGKRAEFSQKMEEVKQLIEQTQLYSKSPEKGFTQYQLHVNTNTDPKTIKQYQANKNTAIATWTEKKRLEFLSSGYSVAISPSTSNYLACDSPAGACCLVASDNLECTQTDINNTAWNTTWLTITNSKTGQVATFTLNKDPFRVTLSIQ